MNKTAKEMFEELKYELFNENERFIQYYQASEDYSIEFDKTYKTISLPKELWFELSLLELQAINKQVEELGWNNEQ